MILLSVTLDFAYLLQLPSTSPTQVHPTFFHKIYFLSIDAIFITN